ncbi:50S ribosomal protein L13 [Candidatus Shikimatogenerans bostrichidophilus]|uniref:50S ribosomal protein L13 n=1 Tax=Candidatus Shikimatogenerans bostrichidophilus TaxID=2943807 RepID=UPI0029666D3A
MKYLTLKTKYYFNNKKKIFLIDANNKILGRLCSQIIKLIMGKNSPKYTPNNSFTNKIIIINAKKIKVDYNKFKNKIYYKYTGYIGNKKQYTMYNLFKKNPSILIKKSIYRMLPKNLLGKYVKKNIFIFNNSNHNFNIKIKKIKILK